MEKEKWTFDDNVNEIPVGTLVSCFQEDPWGTLGWITERVTLAELERRGWDIEEAKSPNPEQEFIYLIKFHIGWEDEYVYRENLYPTIEPDWIKKIM